MRKLYLVCTAHLDPVWLWQKPEGMAEAMSTFRIAADFCDEYDGFVFNHNESVLYEWVMQNDPVLFSRIQRLVKKGKWHIMGGWYLQPDVLMPCGESIIRQIKTGTDFFKKYFGKIPKTAIGFDAFGHSRGLVQILKKCGYENYVYLRPRETMCGPFIWRGFDDSEINTFKLYEWYNTPKGKAVERIRAYNDVFSNRELNLLTWGIGNHGGGPSKKDLDDINAFIRECNDTKIIQSDLDNYFDDLDKSNLKVVDKSLVHCMVGCYTSMVRVKQEHRRLENLLSVCEVMLCQSGVEYDVSQLKEAEKALLFSEFHDILPGTSIKKVEEDSLRLLGYGSEIVERLIWKSFFAMCSGRKKSKDNEIPIMVYNPHPYPIECDFETEFQLAEQNHPQNGVYNVEIYNEQGERVPCQLEHEDSAHGMDWRKKVTFHAKAASMSVSRFDCRLKLENDFRHVMPYVISGNNLVLKNNRLTIKTDWQTGEINEILFDGKSIIRSIKIKVFEDNADPWRMDTDAFKKCIGEFTSEKSPIVTENGEVRTKVQTFWKYNSSRAMITYTFSKALNCLDVDIKVLSCTEEIMYKLCIDTALDSASKAYCQTMFGTEETHKCGKESVFQKWCGLADGNNSVSVLNTGTYGGSFENGEIRLSLLRTPIYSAHPIDGVELAPHVRAYEHIDIGERNFKFRICINELWIDAEAEMFNKPPIALSMFPRENDNRFLERLEIDNKDIVLSAFKKYDGKTIIRLFNSKPNSSICAVKTATIDFCAKFEPYEVSTYVIEENKVVKTDMIYNNYEENR